MVRVARSRLRRRLGALQFPPRGGEFAVEFTHARLGDGGRVAKLRLESKTNGVDRAGGVRGVALHVDEFSSRLGEFLAGAMRAAVRLRRGVARSLRRLGESRVRLGESRLEARGARVRGGDGGGGFRARLVQLRRDVVEFGS